MAFRKILGNLDIAAKQLWKTWATMHAKHSGRVHHHHMIPIGKPQSSNVVLLYESRSSQKCFGSLMGHVWSGTRRVLHKPNLEVHNNARNEPKPAASPVGKRKLGGANPFAKKSKVVAGGTA